MTPAAGTDVLPGRSSEPSVRERKLLRAAQRGDRGARDRVVRAHLPLVRRIALGYRNAGLPLDDLLQEGALGLLDAIDRYDPSRGPSFEAFARFRVRRAIRNALTEQTRLIRLPKHVVERQRVLDRVEARLAAAGVRPTPTELAAATGLSVEAVLEARAATLAPLSLDEPVLADGTTLETSVADPTAREPDADMLASERATTLRAALAKLPGRQRQVVAAQWGLDGGDAATTVAVARELRLSPRRAQAIGKDALYALRDELELAGEAR